MAVDIYHISPTHPRFAFVAYTVPEEGRAAIADLNGKSINLDSPFAQENAAELSVWKNWSGRLSVVPAEANRLVPTSVSADFADLPEWALGNKDLKSDDAEKMEVDMQIKQERDSSPESQGRKRVRRTASKELPRS